MALSLFETLHHPPVKDRGYVHTVRSAKKMIERQVAVCGTFWTR